jgi:hypothetical protein
LEALGYGLSAPSSARGIVGYQPTLCKIASMASVSNRRNALQGDNLSPWLMNSIDDLDRQAVYRAAAEPTAVRLFEN